jgi:hypothetical protein
MMDATVATDARVWGAGLHRQDIQFEIGREAQGEVLRFLTRLPAHVAVTNVTVETIAAASFDHLKCDLERCRARVERDQRFVVVQPVPALDVRGRRVFAWVVAALLGEPVPQNADGEPLMPVYARPGVGRIADGARYHQTREGGASHTDNVSLPQLFDYLVFSCVRPAAVGGDSVLISAFALHDALVAVPDVLAILRRPFWWEYRGISPDLFQAPIITYADNGEPRFRYLRRYLESAHTRAGAPLTADQVWALDTFDAILDTPALRFHLAMTGGEVLIAYDSQVLHARTTFSDRCPGAPADAASALHGPWRFFDRVWVTRHGNRGARE